MDRQSSGSRRSFSGFGAMEWAITNSAGNVVSSVVIGSRPASHVTAQPYCRLSLGLGLDFSFIIF